VGSRSSVLSRNAGWVSSAALAASGLGIALDPRRAGEVLQLVPATERGVAETRAGLGGTYVALGLWALSQRSPDAYAAVGVTWLGAAAFRTAALAVDRPETDWTYWAYLALELTLGLGGLAAGARRRR
jgi:hypothetical protein